MLNFLSKIIPSKHEKDVKLLKPIVEEINRIYEELSSLSDDELKSKTDEFKAIIKENSSELENEKTALFERLRSEALSANETMNINDRLKQIEKELFEVINNTLDDLLPEAFAVVKQTCFRLKEQMFRYEYTGQTYVWDMVPFDVQLMGGIVLHQGKISEMATGEGKTLVAVLPMYLNALAGKGVHLVTVNDYLAKRDSEWMKPVFDFLGITVGAIQSNMDSIERQKYYNLDITYGTNNEFGFDYLRDNMVVESEYLVQREHWYAIVDEVDSVLIDEARTPLIISGPVGQSEQKFDAMNPRVKRLVDAQNRFVTQIVAEASKYLESNTKEDKEKAGVLLLRAYHGLPKHKRLAKLLQEPEYLKLKNDTELLYLRDKGIRMHEIDDELYYVIEEKSHQVDITEKGRELLGTKDEDPDMFVIPDVGTEISILENDLDLSQEDKQKKIDELNLLFAERSDRIHTISQLLRAYSLYEKDVDYIIQDDKVMIVDEHTGRVLEGRRYSEGLHQAIEAKEHVKVERDTQTLATITLQNYFRLYKKLAGMTGTAETEAGEFQKIYNLDVVVIPTNKPIVRIDKDDLIFRTSKEKFKAIVAEIQQELKNGRAVLVGTTSVEVSEVISKMLRMSGIKHNVLNAKQHQKEAEVVQYAGRKGAVTVATNMAGRGTDIKLDPEVKKNGGLAIIGSERHDARRIDRQLRGRSGRQGDPGSSQFFISLEDNLMRLFGGERIANIMLRLKIPEGEPIQHSMITKQVENAQKKVEENNFGIRKRLLDYDNVMNQQREVIYTRRRHALRGERIRGELFEYIEEIADEWYEMYYPNRELKELKNAVRSLLLCEPAIKDENEFDRMKKEEVIEKIVSAADTFYHRKEEMLGSDFMGKLERFGVLQTIDEKWREHLREMDDLKEGIHLRSYAQKDPLLEYKHEAYELFIKLIGEINKESVGIAFKFFPKLAERDHPKARNRIANETDGIPSIKQRQAAQNLNYSRPDNVPETSSAPKAKQMESGQLTTVKTIRRSQPKVGRNDPCPCGSGKKYKHCHGRDAN